MEYNVEELTPLKRKVNVKIPAEEVDSALKKIITSFKKDVKIKGFRKGKAPSHVVEKMFKKDIYSRAQIELIDHYFDKILKELNVEPIDDIDIDIKDKFERGKDFSYSLIFEIRPNIELPEYKGIKVKKEKIKVTEDEINEIIEKMKKQNARLVPVTENRNPRDGDVVTVDFAAYEDGKPLDYKGEDVDFSLGEEGSLKEFEDIIKSLKPGEKGEGIISFSEDFINPDLAGRTLLLKVHLKNIKERKLPSEDELLGIYNLISVEELRKSIEEGLMKFKETNKKSEVQKKIIEELLSKVDFPLPECLVEEHLKYLIEREKELLEKEGKGDTISEEELREKYRKKAEKAVKSHLLLLEIAKKEELTVTSEDYYEELLREAMETGVSIEEVREYYEKNKLLHVLKEKILVNKVFDILYEYANIEEVEDSEEEKEEVTKIETSKTEKVCEHN